MRFFVPGRPVPKARPRIGKGGRMYTPALTKAYERLVAAYCMAARGGREPLSGPVRVEIDATYRLPKRGHREGDWHTGRPDLDNVVKAVLDGVNGVAFADDSQVCVLHASKYYGQRDGVWVIVDQEADDG